MATLEGLEAALRDLKRVPSQAARQAADDIGGLLELQFDEGVDPYGNAWAELAESTLAKGRTPPPLTDTGALRAGTGARPAAGAGISLELGADYGIFHQTGTGNMPARPIFPDGELPDEWQAMIDNAVQDAARRRMEAA